ncbi:MAG: MFS transporter, partial [Spirochaetales bacterium]
TNRGRIEGMNSMMPLVSVLVVFGGFMNFNLDSQSGWTAIYYIIGVATFIIGVIGLFLIDEKKGLKKSEQPLIHTLLYSFRPSVIKENVLLYQVLGLFAVFGISIQIFMPYLIIYYEQTLQISNYVIIMAPAILAAAVITALYGKTYDGKGFMFSIRPVAALLCSGYIILYFCRSMVPVFIGSLLMLSGYLTGMSVFGAMIRDNIPENKAGQFQGVRIIGQVFIPGIIGPAIGAGVLKNAQVVLNSDGTISFLPNKNIWAAAFAAVAVLIILLVLLNRKISKKEAL